MKRVMLDIETLSTSKHAAVLSLGVAVFDDSQVLDTNGWAIDIKSMEGHISTATIGWWMQQNDAAREFSFGGKHHAISVASELRPYIADADEVWANDPDFDLVILQHWWERMPRLNTWPVSFRKYRSVRTMIMLAQRYYIDTASAWTGATSHNPIDDAASQARAVIEVFKALDRRHGEILR